MLHVQQPHELLPETFGRSQPFVGVGRAIGAAADAFIVATHWHRSVVVKAALGQPVFTLNMHKRNAKDKVR